MRRYKAGSRLAPRLPGLGKPEAGGRFAMKSHWMILAIGLLLAGSVGAESAVKDVTSAARETQRSARPTIALGPEAVDAEGHRGRIHTVMTGETLWDISSAYWGTPWVWPSVWEENQAIPNPHLILPGDRIWISSGVMRKITRVQAEQMLEAAEQPAALAHGSNDASPLMETELVPAVSPVEPVSSRPSVRVVEREAMGFVASDTLAAATSIVDSPSLRTWLADSDHVYLGLGQGAVEVGDEFTIFREAHPVKDLGTGRLLGYHVDILGWLVVREVSAESATAEIRMSHSEILRGDQLIPRIAPRPLVEFRGGPAGVEGEIVFMPSDRTHMGSNDHVYLNRGERHGLEVGSEIEVFTAGRRSRDRAKGETVMTPDRVDARMVLVEVSAETSVAYVVETDRELEIGDSIRTAQRRVASR